MSLSETYNNPKKIKLQYYMMSTLSYLEYMMWLILFDLPSLYQTQI